MNQLNSEFNLEFDISLQIPFERVKINGSGKNGSWKMAL